MISDEKVAGAQTIPRHVIALKENAVKFVRYEIAMEICLNFICVNNNIGLQSTRFSTSIVSLIVYFYV